MRTLRYVFATFLLGSALSLSVFGGNIHTGAPQPEPTPTPAPATAGSETSTPFNGDVHTTNSDELTAEEMLAEAALSLVQSVLSLL